MPTRAEIVERALAYPYELPREGFVLVDGEVHGITVDGSLGAAELSLDGSTMPLRALLDEAGDQLADRIPVVGYGSNAAPSQLRRKFSDAPPGCIIPVLAARLRDFDVVYSAHVSVYGAVPATIAPSVGTCAEVVITLLSPDQAEAMLASEGGNYDIKPLPPGALATCDDVDLPGSPQLYVSRFGVLALDGEPNALSAVHATGRAYRELDEPGMLRRVVEVLEPTMSIEDFIVACSVNESARLGWVERLGEWALSTPGVVQDRRPG